MKLRLFCLSVTFVLISTLGAQGSTDKTLVNKCSSGQYYSDTKNQCLPCSLCSDNHLVRKPCSPTTDTICGPFKEFDFFHQHSVANNSSKDQQNDPTLQSKKTEVHLTIYSEGHSNIAVAESKESQHWRKVAFALIGALSGLIFLATLVVLVICRRMNVSNPPRPAHTDEEDADCPYVVIHTIRPPEDDVSYQVPPGPNALHQLARQRHRLYKYHPKRRLLQANEYADDVFESEDSAGSRQRISLQVIPETGHSDNEGDVSPKSEAFPAVRPCGAGGSESTPPKEESHTSDDENCLKLDDPVCGDKPCTCTTTSEHLSRDDNNTTTKDTSPVLSIQQSEVTISSADIIPPACVCSDKNMICSSSTHSLKPSSCLSSADAIPSSCSHPSKHSTSSSSVLCTDGISSMPAPSSELESDGLLTITASEHTEDHEQVSTGSPFNHCQTPTPKKSPPSSPGVVSPLLSVSGPRVTSPTLPATCDEEDITILMETSSLLRSQIPWVKTSGSG